MEVWKQFEENDITHSAAHHLLAILALKKDRGYARVTDVAKYLKITTGSASTNLKGLKQKGLVQEDDNRFLCLSEGGQVLAKAVVARHDIFKKFLIEVLKVREEQAEIDACKTEHLLSHETSEKLLQFMQFMSGNDGKQLRKLIAMQERGDLPDGCPLHDSKDRSTKDCNVCVDRCLLNEC